MPPILNEGKYAAKLSGPTEVSKSGIIIYKTERGALCAAVPCSIAASDGNPVELKSTQTIIKSDRTPQTRTIDTLRAIFGWDGLDPYWLMDADLSEVEFEAVIQHEQGKKDGVDMVDEQGQPVLFSRIAWINPLGSSMRMPEPADRRTILAEYGAMFRALAGGSQVAAPAAPSKAPPVKATPPAKAPPTKPAIECPPSTSAEAWQSFAGNNPGKSEAELGDLWFATLKKKFGTDDAEKITPEQWGQLVHQLDNIPY